MSQIQEQQPRWTNERGIEEQPDATIIILDNAEDYMAGVSIFLANVPTSYEGDPAHLPRTLIWQRKVCVWTREEPDPRLLETLDDAQCDIWIVDVEFGERPTPLVDFIDPEGDVADMRQAAIDYAKAHRVRPATYRSRRTPTHKGAWTPPLPEHMEWPEPMNLFAKPGLPDVQPDMLPPEIAPFVLDQAELLGSAPDMLAISCIFAACACIHDGIKIQPKRHDYGWTESARLWVAFVGDPSMKKSPTMRKAMGHLDTIDIRLSEESGSLFARYEEEMSEYKEQLKRARKAGNPVPTKPEEPPRKRLIAEDFTMEALADLLKSNPRGMVAKFDELASFFGQMDAYRTQGSGKDRAAWLEANNGGRKRIDRVGRGCISVPNFSMRVIGAIQPKSIQAIAHKLPEDGLLQRFLVVMAPPNPEQEADRRPDEQARDTYFRTLDKLFAMEPSEERVKFSDGAQEIRAAFETERKTMMTLASLPPAMTVALGKWDGIFCRLCLVYHAIHCATIGKHPVNVLVSAETAARVSRYMMEYLMFHGLAFWGDVVGGSDRMEHAIWIAGHIAAKRCTELSSRDLARTYSKWAGLPEWVQRDTMRILEDASWITPTRTIGRRTTQWEVNPKAAQTFVDIGEKIEADRARKRAILTAMAERRSA